MSAGPNSIPLWKESIEWKTDPAGRVWCQGCNWKGQHYELLCEPDEETVWCPQCKGPGWSFL